MDNLKLVNLQYEECIKTNGGGLLNPKGGILNLVARAKKLIDEWSNND